MGKFYKGNAPVGEEWVKVLSHIDKDKVEWFVFRKRQSHTNDWATYKVMANGNAEYKANYWFAKNEKTGQLGFARDMALMKAKHSELHMVVENHLKQIGIEVDIWIDNNPIHITQDPA